MSRMYRLISTIHVIFHTASFKTSEIEDFGDSLERQLIDDIIEVVDEECLETANKYRRKYGEPEAHCLNKDDK